MPVPASARLTYRRLTLADLDAFHALIVDPHVRRYLLDGQTMDRNWSRDQVAASDALFVQRGLGLWLTYCEGEATPLGFCGFLRFGESGAEPQLLYAMPAAHAGQGYATEMAQALIEYVREHTATNEIISAVDEPNANSSRVLTKLGFVLTQTSPGAFGELLHYQLRLPR